MIVSCGILQFYSIVHGTKHVLKINQSGDLKFSKKFVRRKASGMRAGLGLIELNHLGHDESHFLCKKHRKEDCKELRTAERKYISALIGELLLPPSLSPSFSIFTCWAFESNKFKNVHIPLSHSLTISRALYLNKIQSKENSHNRAYCHSPRPALQYR